MRQALLSWSLMLACAVGVNGQEAKDEPAVVVKMRELGSVYVTYSKERPKKKDSNEKVKTVITGIDFRPMAGSDPKQIAALVKELATLPELQNVLLLGKDIDDQAVFALPVTDKIIFVQFFNTSITDKGIASLSRYKNLQRFSFTGSGLTDEGMKTLGKLKTLTYLDITDSKITDKGVMQLVELTSLRSLMLENTGATEASIELLRLRLPRINDFERSLK